MSLYVSDHNTSSISNRSSLGSGIMAASMGVNPSSLPVPPPGSNGVQDSWDVYQTIMGLFQAPSYHLIFEVVLILWIFRLLFFTKSYKPHRTVLTEKEKVELIEEWKPEPLVPDSPPDDPVLQQIQNRVVDSKIGKYVSINGNKCINAASLNFLGVVNRPEIEEAAVKALRKYGVGSCGPRGFYGTVDVHLSLEDDLAKFMAVEEAIIYSYGFATIASAIPAYSKRGDIIFCDEGVHFAIQKGVLASRSKVVYFKHNDMDDLERKLKEQEKEDRKNPKKAKVTRRFMLVEGLYINYGDLCPLPRLVELKMKYKVRIFMDESVSFGTIGECGRGVTEYYDVPVDDIDMICASLENALGSVGGFACGKAYVIDHQRLSGLGYCFSASTPPMLTTAASVALKTLQESPDLLISLQENNKYIHEQLLRVPGLKVVGEPISPIIHLQLAEPTEDGTTDAKLLRQIVQHAEDNQVALVLASYLEKEEHLLPPASIRVAVNCDLTKEEMDKIVHVIKESTEKVLQL